MSDANEKKLSPLEQVEARRAAKREASQAAHDAQAVIDLTAIADLEDQYGFENVAVMVLPHLALGLPVRVAVRAPTPAELKRYRDRLKPTRGRRNEEIPGDATRAHEELGPACLVYPAPDVFEKLCEVRPALPGQLGVQAALLGSAKEETAGKGGASS
ncbi:MAG TPA: hypothetical protein VGK73_33980 [Polyangiaceae bacterium]